MILYNILTGYKFRKEILLSTLAGYRKIQEAAQEGIRPLYRSRSWRKEDRLKKKMSKKKNWLGTFWKSRIFVPFTPGSKLKKKLQQMEEQMRPGGRENMPSKIIETSGKTLEMLLKPPAQKQMCSAKKCLARDLGEPKIGCRVNGVGYKLDCKHCLLAGRQSTYIGETGKNGHCRILNHQSKFRSKTTKTREESAFYKHIIQAHSELYKENDELETHFNFEVLKVFKTPLDREVDEGVRMVMHNGVIINSKTEWFSPSIVRTTIHKGGAEVAHQPARGFVESLPRFVPAPSRAIQSAGRPQGSPASSSASQPPGSRPQGPAATSLSQPSSSSSRDQRQQRRQERQNAQ